MRKVVPYIVDGAGRLGLIQISWIARSFGHPIEMDFSGRFLNCAIIEMMDGVHFPAFD